jgi:hypothetical protein
MWDLFSTVTLKYTQNSCGECEHNILEILYLGRFLVVLLLDHEPRN